MSVRVRASVRAKWVWVANDLKSIIYAITYIFQAFEHNTCERKILLNKIPIKNIDVADFFTAAVHAIKTTLSRDFILFSEFVQFPLFIDYNVFFSFNSTLTKWLRGFIYTTLLLCDEPHYTYLSSQIL